MKIKKLVAVAALAALGAVNSYADAAYTFNAGVLTNLLAGQSNWSYTLSGTSFDATYNFTLPSATEIVVKVDPYWGVTPTAATLYNGTSYVTMNWNGDYYQGYTSGIGGQSFTLHVTGTGASGNSFNNFVTAVPEPETFAMLLAGLGLIGAITRRRKSAVVA